MSPERSPATIMIEGLGIRFGIQDSGSGVARRSSRAL